jgi:hypothetical protein
MSEKHNNTQKLNDEQIDLAALFNWVNNIFDNIGFVLFRIFNFFLRNKLITIVITIIGLFIGFYSYKNNKKAFKHQVVVVANFKSTEYLYNKIDNFVLKTTNEELSKISKLAIKPVINIHEYVSDHKQNLEIAKFMSENTIEISKFKDDNNVEKLYKYHKLEYYTQNADTDANVFNALIAELNANEYYLERQQIEKVDTQNRLLELETSVASINKIFDKLGTASSGNELNVQMYAQINDLMLTKQELLQKINQTKIALIEEDKIIFDAFGVFNIQNNNILKVLIPPFLLNFLFLFFGVLFKLYNKYKQRHFTINHSN